MNGRAAEPVLRRFLSLQLLFGLIVFLALLVLLFMLVAVALVHFTSPPKVFAVILQ